MNTETNTIPRIIWILWFQGPSEAPFIVKKCIESWVRHNANWQVVILDDNNLSEYVVLDLPEGILANLALNHKSDLLRLQLLSEYGGVWADATTFCMKPLDDWIHGCTTSGFFTFYKPGRDRIMSSWFIASQKGCPIVLKLGERLKSFWLENEFNVNTKAGTTLIKLLSKTLGYSSKTTRYWFSPLVVKYFKVYPYFVIHYMFERLVSTDPECQQIWSETVKISADGPHRIQTYGLLSPIDENIKKEIDEKRDPLYKLTWKYDEGKYSASALLCYLIEQGT